MIGTPPGGLHGPGRGAMERIERKGRRRVRRKRSVRRRVVGTAERPRLTVFRSRRHISCQIIDDAAGRTLAAAFSGEPAIREELGRDAGNKKGAAVVGKWIAERAKAAGITGVRFDRNGYKYHGRIEALAASAREHGLEF